MSFSRYRKELYDRLTAALDQKVRMVKSKVVEALLYGCATWTPIKGDYQKVRVEHHRMLFWIIGAWFRFRDYETLIRMDNRRLVIWIMVGNPGTAGPT